MAVEEEAAATVPVAEPAPVDIRFATPDDADALALLSQELLAFYKLPVHYQRSYMAHVIAEKAFRDPPSIEILLALGPSRAVGFLAFNESFAVANCQNAVFIQDLFVTRKARTGGVGRALMRRLAEICVERGISQMDWTADPWNEKARHFYEAMGPLLKSEKMYYRLLGPRLLALAGLSGKP
jgi:GNAT superfamily N-acetyltransferase